MNSQIMMLMTSWFVLVIAYVGLFIYRKQLERGEDDTVHVLADNRVLSAQETIAHKMEALERWSKILITVVILYGLIIGGMCLYSVWQANLNVA